MTRESGLDFVIARPMRLTNGTAKGEYLRTAELIRVPSSIAGADLADFMVEACESTIWVGKPVQLGGVSCTPMQPLARCINFRRADFRAAWPGARK